MTDETEATLTVVREGSNDEAEYVVPTEEIEEGDEVTFVSDNRFDGRYSERKEWSGEVTQVNRSPSDSRNTTLKVEMDDDGDTAWAWVSADGTVYYKIPDAEGGNSIGQALDVHNPEQAEAGS